MLNHVSDVPLLTLSQWMERCRERILVHDDTLAPDAVADLVGALANRVSCRALAPETAADLLFKHRYARDDGDA